MSVKQHEDKESLEQNCVLLLRCYKNSKEPQKRIEYQQKLN